MNLDKFKERLQQNIDYALENADYDEEASWNYQQGILLSYKEAEELIYILDSLDKQIENIPKWESL